MVSGREQSPQAWVSTSQPLMAGPGWVSNAPGGKQGGVTTTNAAEASEIADAAAEMTAAVLGSTGADQD